MKVTRKQLNNIIKTALIESYVNESLKEDALYERAQKLFDRIVDNGFDLDLEDLKDIEAIKKVKKIKGGLKLAKEKYDQITEIISAINKISDVKGKSKEEINLIILEEIKESGLIDDALDKGEEALDRFFFTLAFSALPTGSGALAAKVLRSLSSAASNAIRDYVEEKIDDALALSFLKNKLNSIQPGFYEMLFKSDVASQYATKKPAEATE